MPGLGYNQMVEEGMKRRTFIRGIVAAGVLLTTPLEGLSGIFKPQPITATYALRKQEEARKFMEGMAKTFADRVMYGNPLAEADILTGLMKKI